MKKSFFLFLFLFASILSRAQFVDTTALNQYIIENIRDKRPEKVTADQLQKALLGVSSIAGKYNILNANLRNNIGAATSANLAGQSLTFDSVKTFTINVVSDDPNSGIVLNGRTTCPDYFSVARKMGIGTIAPVALLHVINNDTTRFSPLKFQTIIENTGTGAAGLTFVAKRGVTQSSDENYIKTFRAGGGPTAVNGLMLGSNGTDIMSVSTFGVSVTGPLSATAGLKSASLANMGGKILTTDPSGTLILAANPYAAMADDMFYLSAVHGTLRFSYYATNIAGPGVKIAIIGDSQGAGSFQSSGHTLVSKLNTLYPNAVITNYCMAGYNSRQLAPDGTNSYVDPLHNITKAINDGNTVIIVVNTSDDSHVEGAGGVVPLTEWQANLNAIDAAAINAGAQIFYISVFPRGDLDVAGKAQQAQMAAYQLRRFGNRLAYCFGTIAAPGDPDNIRASLQVGDNVHLNDSGMDVVSDVLTATLYYHYQALPSKILTYKVYRSNTLDGEYSLYATLPGNDVNTIQVPMDSAFYRVQAYYVSGYVPPPTNAVQVLGEPE
ncbi:hypothetical protein [Chitinophaga sp. CF418]|uniref:hypothetical protein n=1 Tax=Chitinophaga sp. CF418 TaxID=1855287 RepID=UPI0009161E16|nr:hypothetical protein [Chitinophaga sp. CF418]SHN42216.1 hypothetical protein SAMN05216311_114136 [Chitinophaga sp. CF418]